MGLFDDLLTEIPIIGRAFDRSDDDQLGEIQKIQQLYEGINPNLEWRNFSPENYSFETFQEDPGLRQGQMDYLGRLSGLSQTGLSDVDALERERAQVAGRRLARQGTAAALNDASSRGVAGSGMEMAMREMANQGGAERTRASAMEAAANQAKQRALYTQMYGQALEGQRTQDFNIGKYNNDIINKYNTMNTDLANFAQKYNNEGRMGVRQSNFDNQMDRAKGISGAHNSRADFYNDRRARRQKARSDNYQTVAKGATYAFGGGGADPSSMSSQIGGYQIPGYDSQYFGRM